MSPHKFDEVFLKVTALGDNVIQVVGPDNQNPFVALSTCEQKLEKKRPQEPTYDEGTTLFLVGTWQIEHGVKDLYACVIIHIYGSGIVIPEKVRALA